MNHLEPQESETEVNQASAPELIEVGALAASSSESNGYRHDWALFEMNRVYPRDGNEILIQSDDNNREKIYPRNIAAQMTDGEAIVVTGDSATVKGRMFQTPLFMRMPGTSVFQEVWPISLEATLSELADHHPCHAHSTDSLTSSGAGDCGAWVTNPANGDLYGHLVAGNPSTHLAYIASAKVLFDDIHSMMHSEVTLPPQPETASEPARGILTLALKGTRGLGPVRRPYLVATFGHSEFIAYGPEGAGFSDSEVTDLTSLATTRSSSTEIPSKSISIPCSSSRVSTRGPSTQFKTPRVPKWEAEGQL